LNQKEAGPRTGPAPLEHDPEKCEAVFRKEHAQTRIWSAMAIQPNAIALQLMRRTTLNRV
jgi:hypothetical protein